MLVEEIAAYYANPCPETLQSIVSTAELLQHDFKYNKIWKEFIRASIPHMNEEEQILDLALQLAEYASFTVALFADFIELDSYLIFAQCFPLYKENKKYCNRLIHALTDRGRQYSDCDKPSCCSGNLTVKDRNVVLDESKNTIVGNEQAVCDENKNNSSHNTKESAIISTINDMAVDCVETADNRETVTLHIKITELPEFVSYCEFASKFLELDYSCLLYDEFSALADEFCKNLCAFEHSDLEEMGLILEHFCAKDEAARYLAFVLLNRCEDVQQLCINDSELDAAALERYKEIFDCEPLAALKIREDATDAIFGLILEHPEAAIKGVQCLQCDAERLREMTYFYVSEENLMNFISVFAVLGQSSVAASLFAGKLEGARFAHGNVIIRIPTESHVRCKPAFLPGLRFEKSEAFYVDLLRSSCLVRIYGSVLRFQAILYLVFTGFDSPPRIAFLGSELIAQCVASLKQYRLLHELSGELRRTEQPEVYEAYDGTLLDIIAPSAQTENRAHSGIAKARIMALLKRHAARAQELAEKLELDALSVLGLLKQLESDGQVEIDGHGVWSTEE